jgi:hypothetical protein
MSVIAAMIAVSAYGCAAQPNLGKSAQALEEGDDGGGGDGGGDGGGGGGDSGGGDGGGGDGGDGGGVGTDPACANECFDIFQNINVSFCVNYKTPGPDQDSCITTATNTYAICMTGCI